MGLCHPFGKHKSKAKKRKKKSSNWVALLSLSKKPIGYSTVENPGVPEGLLLMDQIPWYLKFPGLIIIQQILPSLSFYLSLPLPQWYWAWPFYVFSPTEWAQMMCLLWVTKCFHCHSGSCQLCHDKNRPWGTTGPRRRRNMRNKHEGSRQPKAEPFEPTSRSMSKKHMLFSYAAGIL